MDIVLAILLGISLLTSLVCHGAIKSYLSAALLGSVLPPILLGSLVGVFGGVHIQTGWPVAVLVSGTCSLFISFIVGIPFAIVRAKRRVPPDRCLRCQYLLIGNTSGTCPECGRHVPARQQEYLKAMGAEKEDRAVNQN